MQHKSRMHEQKVEAASAAGLYAPYVLEKGSFHELQTCSEQVRYVLEAEQPPDRLVMADCLLTGSARRIDDPDKALFCKGPIDGKCPFVEADR